MNEEERMIAVLQGSYLARTFPKVWYGIKEREAAQEKTDAEKLKDQLAAKFNRRKK